MAAHGACRAFHHPHAHMDHVTLKDALIVGLAQAGALIPDLSLGHDVDGCAFLNLNREEAARYSFLLGVPAITLAG